MFPDLSAEYYDYRIFYWFLAFFHVLYITQVLPIVFPLKLIYSEIAFVLSTLHWHFPYT